MTHDGIFHITAKQQLVSMTVTPYEAEEILQALLETYPDLLAGGQMTPDAPRRWALVKREQGVPDREDTASRWSVDHLFVDQDAIPTLVEVKRSTDTRIRREVVGQMLDYAANGVRYWPIESLQLAFETTQHELGNDATDSVRELTGDIEETPDHFFSRVGDNLRAGRIRMVFVADVVPDELRRIVEFLNEQLSPAEVFAVEVKQYRAAGEPGAVIVPAVYGRTAASSTKSSSRRSPNRTAVIAASRPSTLRAVELVQDLATDVGLVVHESAGGVLVKAPGRGGVVNVYFNPWDSVEIPLQPLRDRGWDDLADSAYAELSSITSKTLTVKNPTLPSEDAVARWDDLSRTLRLIAQRYIDHER